MPDGTGRIPAANEGSDRGLLTICPPNSAHSGFDDSGFEDSARIGSGRVRLDDLEDLEDLDALTIPAPPATDLLDRLVE